MTQEEEKAIIEEKASLPAMRKVPRGAKVPESIRAPAFLRYFLAAKDAVTPSQIQAVTAKMADQAAEGDVKAAEWIRKVFLPDDWLKQLDAAAPEGKRIIEAKAELINRLSVVEKALDKRKTNGTGS